MARLYVIGGEKGDQFFDFKDDVTILGRASDNDIQIKDYSISRNHLKIIRKADKYLIEDLGSRNGTWVDGDLLEPGKEFEAREGIPIAVGNTLIYLGDKAPQDNMLTLYAVSVCSPKGEDRGNLIYKDKRFTSRRNLELIYEVSTVLMQSSNIDDVCKKIMDSLFSYLKRIDSGAILWIDSETGELREIVARSRNNQESIKTNHSRTIVERVIREGKAVMISDSSSEPEENFSRSMEKMLIKSIICVPLIIKSEIRGVFYIHSESVRNGFRRDDLFLVTGLSTPAALAIENGLLHSKREQVEEKLRKAHHELERRVEERTAELIKTNEDLKREIRERKRTEEALRKAEEEKALFLNSTADLVVYHDTDLKIHWANKAAGASVDKAPEDLIGLDCYEVWHQSTEPCAGCPIVLALDTGKPQEAEVSSPDGREWHIRGYPVKNDDNEVVGIVEFCLDITERKKAEAGQEKMQAQLRKAQKMEAVGTLAGGIAHDFNNLLQAVQGYAQLLLLDKESDSPGYQELQEIVNAAERGANLTQQLLTFSRKIDSKLRPTDLNREVENIRRLLERIIPKMIEIELHMAADLAVVNADPAQIEQALMNLAVNAKDAMGEEGKLSIKTENMVLDEHYCRAHPEFEPGEYVMLSVSDTGRGMDKETLEHIFDPFYTTKGPTEGTGLGLSMVHGIVKNHGGHIECLSEFGIGTTFKILVPAIEKKVELARTEEGEIQPGGTETVLLVDDEEYIRALGKKTLEMFGYTVLTATNGEEALELYRQDQERIELVILDLIMPGMGGRKCLGELLKTNPQAKVIIATGYSPDESTDDMSEAEVKSFISKPYNIQDMLRTVREVLDGD